MARKRYDENTKNAFLSAAKDARDKGLSWRVAFEAAKNAGYTGTEPALQQMSRIIAGKTPAAPVIVKRKRGRPAKVSVASNGSDLLERFGSAATAPVVTQTPSAEDALLRPLQALIEKTARAKVLAVLDEVLGAIQKIKAQQ